MTPSDISEDKRTVEGVGMLVAAAAAESNWRMNT